MLGELHHRSLQRKCTQAVLSCLDSSQISVNLCLLSSVIRLIFWPKLCNLPSLRKALLCRLTAAEFDPHSKVSRLHLAAESVALQRSKMAVGLPPMRTATTGLSGRPPNSSPRQLPCSTTGAIVFNMTLHYTTYIVILTPRGLHLIIFPAALHRQELIAGYNGCMVAWLTMNKQL